MRAHARIAVFASVVCLLGSAQVTSADTVDQSYTCFPCANLFGAIPGSLNGQVFTAGLTGTLTGVNINLLSIDAAAVISINTAIGGIPTSTILGSTTIGPGAVPSSQFIAFPGGIPITAGTQYAIVIYLPAGAGLNWFGAQAGTYAGGDLWVSTDNGASWFQQPLFAQGHDVYFQTHVNTVPEPGTLALVGTGLTALLGLRRRKKAL